MSNSVLLSAMTIIAITGVTLTTLKYQNTNNDHPNVIGDDDDYYTDSIESTRLNPKFHFYDVLDKNHSTEKSVVTKRSSGDAFNLIEYSIDEKNVSMIDEMRRDKVKQVQMVHSSKLISNLFDADLISYH